MLRPRLECFGAMSREKLSDGQGENLRESDYNSQFSRLIVQYLDIVLVWIKDPVK